MSYDNWKTTNPHDETLGSAKQGRGVISGGCTLTACRTPTLCERNGSCRVDREPHRHELPPGECVACDRDRGQMHPSHDASPNCESGKRDHCTCDACF